ncbi:MAG TPA: LysM peptidoglycan-binding domain-containing protein [Elusimicrobiota bacterium]|nr:LysM peptidoglycan-binding domain-containing protein [Elusimicrobiota bacterium]
MKSKALFTFWVVLGACPLLGGDTPFVALETDALVEKWESGASDGDRRAYVTALRTLFERAEAAGDSGDMFLLASRLGELDPAQARWTSLREKALGELAFPSEKLTRSVGASYEARLRGAERRMRTMCSAGQRVSLLDRWRMHRYRGLQKRLWREERLRVMRAARAAAARTPVDRDQCDRRLAKTERRIEKLTRRSNRYRQGLEERGLGETAWRIDSPDKWAAAVELQSARYAVGRFLRWEKRYWADYYGAPGKLLSEIPLSADPISIPIPKAKKERTVALRPASTGFERPRFVSGPSARLTPPAAGPSPAPNPVLPDDYIVQPGDTLYSIARALYGDGSAWRNIYERNRDAILRGLLGTGLRLRLGESPVREESSGRSAGPTAASSGHVRLYRAQSGETLPQLAGRLYGDPGRWGDIYAANQERLSRGLLEKGMLLVIP